MSSATSNPPAVVQRAPALIRNQVADYLRHRITNMELLPGTPLVEREICEVTTASRATVREALRQLESEGLIRSEMRRGSFVATLSRTETREIYVIRAQLEGLAGRLFTLHATPDQVAALVRVVDRLALAVSAQEPLISAKAEFYSALLAGANNRELTRVLDGLRQRISLLRATSLSVPGRPIRSLNEIKAITAAILEGNAEQARQLCVSHVEAAEAALFSVPGAHFSD